MPTSNDPLYPYRSTIRDLVSVSDLLKGSSASLAKTGNSLVPGGKKDFDVTVLLARVKQRLTCSFMQSK